jgi:hypothetical protein
MVVRLGSRVISGRLVHGPRVETSARAWPFDEVAALWLVDVQPPVDPTTCQLYENTYVDTHFAVIQVSDRPGNGCVFRLALPYAPSSG